MDPGLYTWVRLCAGIVFLLIFAWFDFVEKEEVPAYLYGIAALLMGLDTGNFLPRK